MAKSNNQESIVLGGGCFWCFDTLFSIVNGVSTVTCGYSGGTTSSPTYEQVITDTGGHAEVVKIDFDSKIITLSTILKIFWATHDPTTPNQQGADVGSQYRSIVLYNNAEQKLIINTELKAAQKLWTDPIVTAVEPLTHFYTAEAYHQNYFLTNPSAAYCQIVINPKLAHFRSSFSQYLKPSS